MKTERLSSIFSRYPDLTLLVVGDFFLDEYQIIEHSLKEISIETGLEAHQVIEIRSSPGAAGTVTNNLTAMGVHVQGLGVVGEDGHGFELKRALKNRGVDTSALIESSSVFTPTYTKPMLREKNGSMRELNRLDVKNRRPLGKDLEDEIIARLKQMVSKVDGVIIADQVQERNCGVITDRVREAIADLARQNPNVIIGADSRERIGLFRDVIIKPNAREATRIIHPEMDGEVDRSQLEKIGAELFQRNGQTVFLTLGSKGILAYHSGGMEFAQALPVRGPIDIVGAGDSAMSGIITALCAGATPGEAAQIGNLAASVTVHQVGTTGVASREDMARVAQLA